MSNENALVPVNYAVMEYNVADLKEVIQENLGGQTIDPTMLDRVRVPAGGVTTWTVPTLEGDQEIKTIEGILVHFSDPKAYWKHSMEETGGGTAPDCASDDGITGIAFTADGPGGDCATCPFNQWGSDPKGGKGKACKDMRNLFILREHSILPLVVVAPPTSIQPIRQFMLRLTSAGVKYTSVVIGLSLEKVKNDGGIWYSRIVPSLVRRLPPEQAAHMDEYAKAIRPVLQKVRAIDVLNDNDNGAAE